MASKITRIQVRRDTTSSWESENPILSDGEIGIEFIDGSTTIRMKVGDNAKPWNELEYIAATDILGGAYPLTGPPTVEQLNDVDINQGNLAVEFFTGTGSASDYPKLYAANVEEGEWQLISSGSSSGGGSGEPGPTGPTGPEGIHRP